MHGEMVLAPAGKIVDYLAVLLRFFGAAGGSSDPEDTLLMGHVADTLHNVPQMIWRYDHEGWWKPAQVNGWIKEFPDILEKRGAPPVVAARCRSILSFDGAAQELGVSDDFAELDLAPPEKLERSLELITNGLLAMRMIRIYGVRPGESWDGMREKWPPQASDAGKLNALLATALLPLPRGLVHWEMFDEARFLAGARGLAAKVSDSHREYWTRFFAVAEASGD